MSCIVCDNKQGNRFFTVKEMMFGNNDVFNYFECPNCGCVQISEIPKDMSKYYSEKYYSLRDSIPHQMNGLKKTLVARKVASEVFDRGIVGKLICRFRGSNNALIALNGTRIDFYSKILEVGSGTGSLLYKLNIAGFKHLTGVDPFVKEDIKYSPEFKVIKGTIHDIKGSFDLILFDHSFEHIQDQLETLVTTQKLLKNNGMCVIRTPTVSSYAFEHYGANWVQLDAPRHLVIHSINSLNWLLEKANLKCVKVIYDSTEFQFWGSEQNNQGIHLNSPKSYSINPNESIFSKKDMKKYIEQSRELNKKRKGDQAVFYIEKQ